MESPAVRESSSHSFPVSHSPSISLDTTSDQENSFVTLSRNLDQQAPSSDSVVVAPLHNTEFQFKAIPHSNSQLPSPTISFKRQESSQIIGNIDALPAQPISAPTYQSTLAASASFGDAHQASSSTTAHQQPLPTPFCMDSVPNRNNTYSNNEDLQISRPYDIGTTTPPTGAEETSAPPSPGALKSALSSGQSGLLTAAKRSVSWVDLTNGEALTTVKEYERDAPPASPLSDSDWEPGQRRSQSCCVVM